MPIYKPQTVFVHINKKNMRMDICCSIDYNSEKLKII